MAAVNYHFDIKLKLLIEMIDRRAGSLNHARQVRLESVEINKDTSYETVRALICAMWEPLLQYYLSGDSGWHYYCQYLARMSGADVPEFREILNREYNQGSQSFLKSCS